jgi:nitric oxide dioxygenase
MLNDSEKAAIRQSWRLVIPIAETAADLFYRRLFELKPEYRQLFSMDMASQKRKLLHMLAFVVKSLDYREADWRNEVSAD